MMSTQTAVFLMNAMPPVMVVTGVFALALGSDILRHRQSGKCRFCWRSAPNTVGVEHVFKGHGTAGVHIRYCDRHQALARRAIALVPKWDSFKAAVSDRTDYCRKAMSSRRFEATLEN